MSEGYKIAAGYNVALGSLVDIETIIPTGDEPFFGPKALPLYEDGDLIIRGDAQLIIRGYASVVWQFGRLTYAQYAYLKTTYCSGGLSGYVTILTRLGSSTFTRKNAVMQLKTPAQMKAEYWYGEAEVTFIKLETPS